MNAEKEKEFIKMIDEAGRFCEVYLNYNPDTVAGYRRAWMKILDFMTIYGLDSLDKKSQIKFWDIFNYSKQGKTRHHSWDTKYVIQRAYRMLVSYYETKSIPERFFDVPDKETFIEPFVTYCNDYLQYLSLKLRRSSITVSAYKHSLHQFLRYLEKEKINEIEKLDIAIILNYIISLTPEKNDHPLFFNSNGSKFTRQNISYMLSNYANRAKELHPELIPDTISPHTLRHSKAMHLLQAGVNIVYIRDILGHATIRTTEIYAKADSKLKREAIEKAYVQLTPDTNAEWDNNSSLLDWLSKF